MKPLHLFAPALALVGSAYWLNQKRVVIHELTEKTEIIRERIVHFEEATFEAAPSIPSPVRSESKDELTFPDGSLNWKWLAEIMSEARNANGVPPNVTSMLKYQEKLMEMTEDQVKKGLEEVASLDIEPEVLSMLQVGLFRQLSVKNPLAALTAIGDPLTSGAAQISRLQSNILAKVAKNHPAAAIAWIDQMIADGKLQTHSLKQSHDVRLRFESSLINQLITSDYPSSKSRLNVFTDDEKVYLLTRQHQSLTGEQGASFIKLARESLPPEKVSAIISQSYGKQYYDNLSSVSEAIKDVPLTQIERANAIATLVGNFSQTSESEGRFNEIYEWSRTEAPGKEVAFVTEALLKTGNRQEDPQTGFEKALAVAKTVKDPEVLTTFVARLSSDGNEGKVNEQLEKFKNSELGKQYRTLVEALPKSNTTSD